MDVLIIVLENKKITQTLVLGVQLTPGRVLYFSTHFQLVIFVSLWYTREPLLPGSNRWVPLMGSVGRVPLEHI